MRLFLDLETVTSLRMSVTRAPWHAFTDSVHPVTQFVTEETKPEPKQ